MNIGFDGMYATNGSNDSERYTRFVIEEFATDYPEHRLYVYTPNITKKTRLKLIDDLHNVEYRLPAASGFQGGLWRAFGITNCLQSDKVELYHGLNGVLPLNIAAAHVPTVLSIHEPDHHRSDVEMTWWKKTFALHRVGMSARDATRIIVYSDNTRTELYDRYGIDRGKVDIIDINRNISEQLMEIYHKAMEDYKSIHR